MLTTALDLLGMVALAVFAWFVWEPLPLAVCGAGALLASWRMSKMPRKAERT